MWKISKILSEESKKKLIFLLKIVLGLLSFYFIFRKISETEISTFSFSKENKYIYIFLIINILLMPCNWILEAVKWQLLVSKFEKISLQISLKAVLTGLSLAMFTPNRLGELPGRSLVLQKQNRGKGIWATLFAGLAQMTSTVLFGLLSLYLIKNQANIRIENPVFLQIFSLILATIIVIFLIFLPQIAEQLPQIRFLPEKLKKSLLFAQNYHRKTIFKTLIISSLRYIIFSFQLYLFLHIFGITLTLREALTGIPLSYLIASLLPSFLFAEFGIRGSTALIFIGFFTHNHSGIIAAVFSLWLLNLAIPAAAGNLCLLPAFRS